MASREEGVSPRLVVLSAGPEEGSAAMAREASLAAAARTGAGPPCVLRFHDWAGPTLSLGKTQRPSADLEEGARAAGVALARRPTGGGWLLHLPGDLAVTLVLRGPLRPGELRGAARLVGEAIARALAGLGVEASAAPAGATPAGASRADVCFERLDREEVSVGSAKVAGVALARVGRAALVQAAVPLARAERALAAFEARWDPRRGDAVVRTRGIDAGVLAERIEEEIARRLPGVPVEEGFR